MLSANNIIPSLTVVFVLFIIYVSIIPGIIKLILAIFSISFLLPVSREIMFKNKLRKIRVALYTSLVFSFGFSVEPLFETFSLEFTMFFDFLFIFFMCSLGIFCYGIPASIIAELISGSFSVYRTWISAFIHIGLGFFTYFIEPFFCIFSVICSIIFFLIDEGTRRKWRET